MAKYEPPIHKVYGLFDFDTNELKYIGCTQEKIDNRLKKHLEPVVRKDMRKWEYMMECLEKGALPVWKVFFEFTNRADALKMERLLIKFYTEIGVKLLNVQSVKNGK